MNPSAARFFFDYVDPISYLVESELQAAEQAVGTLVERVPLELCPPPEPLVDYEAEPWIRRWEDASRAASELGVSLHPQTLIPWTRKAHELVLHARAHDAQAALHARLFRATFTDDLDIGRIDVLVGIAVELGLDPTETKAVLDVDRYSGDVTAARAAALAEGITQVPTLVAGGRRLQGFHNRTALGTFLHATRTPDNKTD